jgi:hypothetical protein
VAELHEHAARALERHASTELRRTVRLVADVDPVEVL